MENVHVTVTAYREASHVMVALHQGRDIRDIQVSKRNPGAGIARFHPFEKKHSGFGPAPGNIKAAWLNTLTDQAASIRIYLAARYFIPTTAPFTGIGLDREPNGPCPRLI